MTNTKKVTKNDNFNAIKAILMDMDGTDELVAFIEHEQTLLSKKSSKKNDEMTKVNTAIDENIISLLYNARDNEKEGLTASEILDGLNSMDIEGVTKVSLPKVNSRLSNLGKEQGKIDRVKDKKAVVFKLGTGEGFNVKKQTETNDNETGEE